MVEVAQEDAKEERIKTAVRGGISQAVHSPNREGSTEHRHNPQGEASCCHRQEGSRHGMERIGPMGRMADEEKKKEREQNVEMLLNGERPSMPPDNGTIVLDIKYLGEVPAERGHLVEQDLVEERDEQEKVKCRVDLQATADKETFEVD
jgi:hypothetical protein